MRTAARAARAEWTKLRTVPSSLWLVAAVVGFTVALSGLIAWWTSVTHCPTPRTCGADLPKLSLSGVWLGQVAVIVLAVLAVSGEHATRMVQTTLLAVPRRLLVFGTKAVVVAAVALAAGAAGVAGSVLAARLILPGGGFTAANGYRPLSLADEPTARAAVGSALYLGLVALLALGLAAVVRDTAAAITVTLLLLYATPMMRLFVSQPVWVARLDRYTPMAGLAVQVTEGSPAIGPWHGLAVLAGYAGAALVVGGLLFTLRDA